MSTATAAPPTEPDLRDVLSRAEEAQQAAARAQALAQEAAAKAAEAQHRANLRQQAARRKHAERVISDYPAKRREHLTATTEAKRVFADAALAGESPVAPFLAWTRATAVQHAAAVEHAEAMAEFGPGKVNKLPTEPMLDYAAELSAVLRHAGLEILDQAVDAMRAKRSAVTSGQSGQEEVPA